MIMKYSTLFYHTVRYSPGLRFIGTPGKANNPYCIHFGSSLEVRAWAMALWRGGVVWGCAPQAAAASNRGAVDSTVTLGPSTLTLGPSLRTVGPPSPTPGRWTQYNTKPRAQPRGPVNLTLGPSNLKLGAAAPTFRSVAPYTETVEPNLCTVSPTVPLGATTLQYHKGGAQKLTISLKPPDLTVGMSNLTLRLPNKPLECRFYLWDRRT